MLIVSIYIEVYSCRNYIYQYIIFKHLSKHKHFKHTLHDMYVIDTTFLLSFFIVPESLDTIQSESTVLLYKLCTIYYHTL